MGRLTLSAGFSLGAAFMGWMATVPLMEQLAEPWMEPALRGGFAVIGLNCLILATLLAWPRRS